MYDSITPADIPTSAEMVAGYVDGSYAWSAAGWARFPNAVKVRIAVGRYVPGTHVYDCETGDFSPTEVCQAVQVARSQGENPTVYCNTSTWPAVRRAFASAGLSQPPYWVAAYPGGGPVIPVGAIAHQYANPLTSGGHYDLSVVADFWPGVDLAYSSHTGQLTGGFGTLTDAEIQARFVAVLEGIAKTNTRVDQIIQLVINGNDSAVQPDGLTSYEARVIKPELDSLKAVAAPDISALSAAVAMLTAKVDVVAGIASAIKAKTDKDLA